MPAATEMLREDHRKVETLFERFRSTTDPAERKRIVDTALKELVVHSALEEEFVYPKLHEQQRSDINRAEEEHHVVELLIKELDGLDDDEKLDAKFSVLAENVKHHVKEEESEILPQAERTLNVQSIGAEMSTRKKELEKKMEGPIAQWLGKAVRKKMASG
jgi:hemerythrin superfamily protein